MKRYLALMGAAVLAISTSLGSISAQTGVPVNADGSYVVASDDGAPIASGAGHGLIGGVPIMLIPSAPDSTTATTTSLVSTEGTATENVPVDAVAPADSAPDATDSVTADGGFCSQYATWYDAQLAYENLGATAADPALVQEVDANYDGIACEEMMA